MKPLYYSLIALSCTFAGVIPARALTVEEIGTRSGEYVTIQLNGTDIVPVEAGVLQLNVNGSLMDGFCIDPFHFSDGVMPGYQAVELTSAPKGGFMSAGTALEIERLWASFYSPTMSASQAAGLQIAIWELTGGSAFKLWSHNDFGAAGLLNTVEALPYNGSAEDLVGLTGPGQDYGVARTSIDGIDQNVPDAASTVGLLALGVMSVFVLRRVVDSLPARA